MDFDLALAKERSNKNPVYRVQYAYVRLANILAKAEALPKEDGGHTLHAAERRLLKLLDSFPELLQEIARSYKVHHLPAYALELSDALHGFYEHCRVIDNEKVNTQRLRIVQSAHQVFDNLLATMGISRPERM